MNILTIFLLIFVSRTYIYSFHISMYIFIISIVLVTSFPQLNCAPPVTSERCTLLSLATHNIQSSNTLRQLAVREHGVLSAHRDVALISILLFSVPNRRGVPRSWDKTRRPWWIARMVIPRIHCSRLSCRWRMKPPVPAKYRAHIKVARARLVRLRFALCH